MHILSNIYFIQFMQTNVICVDVSLDLVVLCWIVFYELRTMVVAFMSCTNLVTHACTH